MKAKPQKMGNPGKFGSVAGKKGHTPLPATKSLQGLNKTTKGSAMGVLSKHFK